jgi:hypothetical protein
MITSWASIGVVWGLFMAGIILLARRLRGVQRPVPADPREDSSVPDREGAAPRSSR